MTRALWTATLLLAAGCAVDDLPSPVLLDVCQSSQGPCVNQAYAGERTGIVLIGDHFNPAFSVDVNNDDPPRLRGVFQAYIGQTPIDDLRRHSEMLLVGTLPGTVPLGTHDVTLEVPGGMHARLPEAFFIADPLTVTVAPEHQSVPVGHSFGLDVILQNLGPALLTQITVSLAQEGDGQFLLPADSVLASLGGESTSTTTLQLQAQQSGPDTLLLEVSALAGGNVRVGTLEPLAVDLLALPQAALVASAEVSPTTVDPTESFELIIDVFNTGGTDALDVEVIETIVSGSGSVSLGDPAPARLDIAAGSRQTIRFSGQALQRGTVVFDVHVHGVEAISGRLLGPVAANPASVEIR